LYTKVETVTVVTVSTFNTTFRPLNRLYSYRHRRGQHFYTVRLRQLNFLLKVFSDARQSQGLYRQAGRRSGSLSCKPRHQLRGQTPSQTRIQTRCAIIRVAYRLQLASQYYSLHRLLHCWFFFTLYIMTTVSSWCGSESTLGTPHLFSAAFDEQHS